MPSLFITTPGTRASLVSERLRIEAPPVSAADQPLIRDIPLIDIEQVIMNESAHITLSAIGELLRREIPLVLTSNNDRILGLCLPPAPNSTARMEQYQRAHDPTFALALAINWVEAKILNSRRVLQRLAANRKELEITPHLLALANLAESCRTAQTIQTLRGYEGTSAGRYFECYATFFPKEIPFESRSRRPPLNPPNAILSYAYTLLTVETEAFLHAIGLDPAIGFFHEPAERRPSLALDIIEPFRAPLADAMALDLLTHGVLNPQTHFEAKNAGVYLNTEGRRRFFVAYERRMDREFTSEQHGRRTTLRQELRQQCRAVKKAIVEGEPFEPFLMN